MRDWASRYRAGEHHSVWADIRSFGARLSRDQRLEAAAVVRIVIARVQANLVRIELELHRLGYEFVSAPAERKVRISSDQDGTARQAPAASGPVFEARCAAFGITPICRDHLEAYEANVAPVPMVLAEFWSQIGWVDFTGRHGAVAPALFNWQPMVINSPVGLTESFKAFLEDDCETGFMFELIPALEHHGGFGATHMVHVDMQFGADARLGTGEWLVDYFRRMTKHACLDTDGDGSAGFKRELDRIGADWSPF